MVKKIKKVIRNDTRMRITTKSLPLLEGHPLPMPANFGRRPFLRSKSYPANRITEWQTERSHNHRLICESNSNNESASTTSSLIVHWNSLGGVTIAVLSQYASYIRYGGGFAIKSTCLSFVLSVCRITTKVISWFHWYLVLILGLPVGRAG